MSDPILLREDADGIATLTLNSPGSLNALSDAMLAALKDAFAATGGGPGHPRGDPERQGQGVLRGP